MNLKAYKWKPKLQMEEDKVKNKAKRINPKIRFKPKIDFGTAKYEKIKIKFKRKN